MRYEIRYDGKAVALFQYADLAEAAAAHAPVPVELYDTFTGKYIHVVRAPQPGERVILAESDLPFGSIDQLIRNGQKIMAIKIIRELTHLGLADSKRIADARQEKMNREAREAGNAVDGYFSY